jgi:hypothetical protein
MKFAKGKAPRATQLFGRKVSFNRVVENDCREAACQPMICDKCIFCELMLPD